MKVLLAPTFTLIAVSVSVAQSPPAVISSVKRTAAIEEGITGNYMQGGTYRVGNAPLTVLLQTAYGMDPNRIVGGPEWIHDDRWDVEAKADAGIVSVRQLVQTVLKERFRLDALVERRDRPIYALRLARAEGSLGPNLSPSKLDCGGPENSRKVRDSGALGAHGERPCAIRSQRGEISFAGMPLRTLIPFLPSERVVQDETKSTGPVDLSLKWTYTGDGIADQSAMLTALRDQLGLKLESSTAAVDVLVIDHIERPSEN